MKISAFTDRVPVNGFEFIRSIILCNKTRRQPSTTENFFNTFLRFAMENEIRINENRLRRTHHCPLKWINNKDATYKFTFKLFLALKLYLYEKLIKPNGLSLLISFALIPTGNPGGLFWEKYSIIQYTLQLLYTIYCRYTPINI